MPRGRRFEEPKLNLKKVFAVAIAFVVLIMVIIMLNGIFTGEDEGNITSEDYFVAYQNNKWGVINSKGDIVIDPSYAEMIVIPNSKKDVFLCTYDVNYETGEYKTKALNSKNEDILTGYEEIEAIGNTDEGQNLTYNPNVLKVKNNGKYGLIDFSGKELAPCNYEEITAIPDVEDKFLARKDGNYGVLNEEGREIVNFEYAEILNFGEDENTGFIVRNSEGKYGLVDNLNNKVLNLNYDGIKNIHSGDLYVVKQGEKDILINREETRILESGYDEIAGILTNIENGIIFITGNKYGIMKTTGEIVIPAEYDSLKEAKSGILISKTNRKIRSNRLIKTRISSI